MPGSTGISTEVDQLAVHPAAGGGKGGGGEGEGEEEWRRLATHSRHTEHNGQVVVHNTL